VLSPTAETRPTVSSISSSLSSPFNVGLSGIRAATKRLEQAGVMVFEPGTNLGDRQSQFAKFQIDAPACDNCGSITVRNGNCYLCHNCGNSMGCS
jgi:hypothetical protein